MRNQVLFFASIAVMAIVCSGTIGGVKMPKTSVSVQSIQETEVSENSAATEISIQNDVKAQNITEMNLVGYEGRGKIVKDKDAIESFINLVESISVSDVDSVGDDVSDIIYGFRAVELTDAAGNKTVVSFSGDKYVCVDDKKYELNVPEDEINGIYEEINRLFALEEK